MVKIQHALSHTQKTPREQSSLNTNQVSSWSAREKAPNGRCRRHHNWLSRARGFHCRKKFVRGRRGPRTPELCIPIVNPPVIKKLSARRKHRGLWSNGRTRCPNQRSLRIA